MPVIFVHGVSVRQEHNYYLPSLNTRNALFRKFTLPGIVPGIDPQAMTISNPYWGGHAAKMRWDGESLPQGRGQTFGSSDEIVQRIVEEALIQHGPDDRINATNLLPTIARRHGLTRALEVIWPSAELAGNDISEQQALELMDFSRHAFEYAAQNEQPAWFDDVADNDGFVERLLNEIQAQIDAAPGDEQFGIAALWQRIKNGARNIATAAAATVTNPVVRMVRPSLNEKISLFVGDVFVYLRSREKHGANSDIVKLVSQSFLDAMQERSAADPLIIVGHSMGGNISYDLLTGFLQNDVQCDVLLTVGSQVPLFEEMKLFKVSDESIVKPNKVPKPANVDKWINVYDRADVFSYTADKVFADVADYEYKSGETVATSHGAYLLQPRFHQRLNQRIQGQ